MFTIKNFWFEAKNPVGHSHVIMYVEELNTYVHIWDIETETPCVKECVKGTYRQKKVTGKRKCAALISAAKEMMKNTDCKNKENVII